MSKEFRLPDLGEGVSEGQILRLLVSEGDRVTEDQPLMEVETDKASVEIPSPHTGVVSGIHVTEHQVVNVGDLMVTFDGDDAPAPAPAARAASAGGGRTATRAAPAPPTTAARTKPASPAVRKLARELGIDLQTINGSGPGGRVTRADVEAARKPGGTVELAPASSAVKRAPASASVKQPAGKPDTDPWGPITREPLTRPRKAIAEAMTRSASTIPTATDTDDADVTDLDTLRRGYHAADNPDRKLSILPFVVRATAIALGRHPIFNASFDADNEQIVHHRYISIAIGVQTDRGLIAPVLRHADQLTVPQIADELAVLADKARTASFDVNDTRGGTFTISNAGAVGGSRYSIPIINPPQAAILALGRTRRQPWVVDDKVVPRLILPLSMSFDHRLADGADEVRFMQTIIGLLERPAGLVL